MSETTGDPNFSCPVPSEANSILLAHGGSGRAMQKLLQLEILPRFGNAALNAQHDGAIISTPAGKLAFTTDSYVVRPLFFPGGTIGSLAVHGTINDLAMCGARPLALSCAMILEEGLPRETLNRVLDSIQRAAKECGVDIVTGDTKVVDRGKGDGIYLNTSGVGLIEHIQSIEPKSVKPGDAVILSGDVGRHGIAVMSVREQLDFEVPVESDSAPLWKPVEALLKAGVKIHCLRDLTRGGLATALNEIVSVARVDIEINETNVPISGAVRGACELLGLDPLYVANEGRFIAIVPSAEVSRAIAVLRGHEVSAESVDIGRVTAGTGSVILRTPLGTRRVLDLLSGEQLPRIC